jgi:hypothetical protein
MYVATRYFLLFTNRLSVYVAGETKLNPKISTLPSYTNVNFIGREEYLQKIDDIFAASHSSQQRVVIWGLSGVG